MAAVLASGPSAAASHLTAAALWGLVDAKPRAIDITVPHSRRHRCRDYLRIHRARSMGSGDSRKVVGILTTSPARTIVDIAAVLTERALEDALDRALGAGLLSLKTVRRYIDSRRLGRRPGVGRLRRLIEDREHGVPDGELERRFLRLIRRARIPEPSRQYRTAGRRLDFAFVEARIAIELDGFASHRTGVAFRDDRRRQNALVLEGWLPLRFTWQDVTKHEDLVIDTLRRALAERGGRSFSRGGLGAALKLQVSPVPAVGLEPTPGSPRTAV